MRSDRCPISTRDVDSFAGETTTRSFASMVLDDGFWRISLVE